ncbi:MAG TPA: SynChlorMet cassette radical SAM/SPASM protein ScmE [Candidatus Anammoximicrobium sp.]|nr:SynChlorMet cassette radical SAM/SPASM protein ScmE [Candidatus Anammoximicrobium sp.]
MTKLMPTPRTVDLELTSRCNLRCRYCYYMNNEGVAYEDMPTERWLALFEELGRAKVMDVCLSGGEALLRPDFFELLDGVVRNRMRFQLLTNGWPVTAEVARRLKATGRCNSVQVSLDGSRPEVHEALRGRGSFAPALRAIKILQAEGLPTTVRATIHAFNIEDLPALAQLLLEEIGLPSFSTNAISSLGTQAKYGDDLFLAPALRLRAMHVLAELDGRYPGRIQASAGPLAEWKMFHEMEAARRNGGTIPGRGRLTACGCIYMRLAVRADGAYIPCCMLPQMVLGYAGRDSLEEVWRNAPQFNALRERIHVPLSAFSRCRDCDYNALCTGNCPGTALSAGGDPNRPSDEGCLKLFQQALAAEGLSLW